MNNIMSHKRAADYAIPGIYHAVKLSLIGEANEDDYRCAALLKERIDRTGFSDSLPYTLRNTATFNELIRPIFIPWPNSEEMPEQAKNSVRTVLGEITRAISEMPASENAFLKRLSVRHFITTSKLLFQNGDINSGHYFSSTGAIEKEVHMGLEKIAIPHSAFVESLLVGRFAIDGTEEGPIDFSRSGSLLADTDQKPVADSIPFSRYRVYRLS